MKTRDLVLMAMYIALFFVLDFFGNMIPILQMPQGGSVSISVIALLVASYHLGWKKGLGVALGSVLIQFLSGPIVSVNLIGFGLDYVVGYSVYGLASLFKNYKFFYSGVLVTNFVRFCASTLSGVIVFETPLWASIVYNAPYMVVTAIVALVFVPLLCVRIAPKMN